MKLISLSGAFVLGVYLGSIVTLPLLVVALLFIAPLLLFSVCYRVKAHVWAPICIAAVIGGVLVFGCSISQSTLHLYNDQGVVQISGVVERDSEFDGQTTKLRLSAHRISFGDEASEVSGVVVVYSRGYVSYSAGDDLLVKGELLTPQSNPSTGRRSVSRDGVQSVMFSPDMELVGRGWLYGFRDRLSKGLAASLPEPQCSLAQALFLGIRTHVPEDLSEGFRISGTSHVMAVSGFNVAVIGGMFLGVAAWVFGKQRPTYIIVCLVAVWLYAFLAGMESPVYRAAIMFSLFLVALWIGRPYSAVPAIAFAAAIIVGFTPRVIWDVSFQLTFASVLGIVLLSPPLTGLGNRVTNAILGDKGSLASIARMVVMNVAVGLGATMATLPILAYCFGDISIVGLPATIALLPAVSGATVMALVVSVVGVLVPLLARVIGCVAWLFLTYIVWVVDAFASLPFASSQVPSIDGAWVWGYYGVALGLLWGIPSRKRLGRRVSGLLDSVLGGLDRTGGLFDRFPKKWLAVSLALGAILLWAAIVTAPPRQLQVSFLDVGQGDGLLISTPTGQRILVDGGPDPDKICREVSEKLPFWDRSLDLVVLTHPDDDHLVGLVEVLKRYDVGQVLEPGLEIDSPAYREWRALLDQKNIERTIAVEGQEINMGAGITLEVLNPPMGLAASEDVETNNVSVVLRLTYARVSFLLMGDLDGGREREILHREGVSKIAVLKVSHHGSNSATSRRFLTTVQPQVAVVSVGEDNPFGHPHEAVMARLEEQVALQNIYLTSEDGTVTFTTDGERLWVDTER